MRLTNLFTGQHPLIIHVSGDWRSPVFKSILKMARNSVPTMSRPEPCDEVTTVTWNNHVSLEKCQKLLGSFEESCAWWEVEPMVLGSDVPHPWNNRQHKIGTLIDACENKIKTPYIIASDSGDSLLLGTPAEILWRYKRHFTADLVFLAGGPHSWPPLQKFLDFEKSIPWAKVSGDQTGLCPGTFIGKTEFVLEFFKTALEQPVVPDYPHSEQATVKVVWPQFYPRATLDYLSIMFQYWTGPHLLRIDP